MTEERQQAMERRRARQEMIFGRGVMARETTHRILVRSTDFCSQWTNQNDFQVQLPRNYHKVSSVRLVKLRYPCAPRYRIQSESGITLGVGETLPVNRSLVAGASGASVDDSVIARVTNVRNAPDTEQIYVDAVALHNTWADNTLLTNIYSADPEVANDTMAYTWTDHGVSAFVTADLPPIKVYVDFQQEPANTVYKTTRQRIPEWKPYTLYNQGDLVRFSSDQSYGNEGVYRAASTHTSSNLSGAGLWTALTEAPSEPVVLRDPTAVLYPTSDKIGEQHQLTLDAPVEVPLHTQVNLSRVGFHFRYADDDTVAHSSAHYAQWPHTSTAYGSYQHRPVYAEIEIVAESDTEPMPLNTLDAAAKIPTKPL